MAVILSGSIDLNKIDKTKIVTTDKNGNPFQNGAKYLNVQVFINDEVDQFGNNASIAINQSKEERESGEKKTYIGNLKEVWRDTPKQEASSPEKPTNTPVPAAADDDLPFW